MSVIVENLVKTFDTQNAVDDISFSVSKGQILGFLGPNGAGKSTTMKMITGYYPQTSGTIKVCGIDTNDDALLVKSKIGYLPEHNPLYLEMYVYEYLSFIAGLHGIKDKKARIELMIEKTGLTKERNKIIATLSKGYRQRVGLAQAMIHDPEVLILDEPTSGLDPNQLVEIRNLIKNIGKEKTVIFSSHIMQEVQEICDKVVIINKGKIVANDSISALQQLQSGQSIISIEFLQPIDIKIIQSLPQVVKILKNEGNTIEISVLESKKARKDIFDAFVKNGWTLLSLYEKTSSVEDVFQKLTA